MRSGKALATGLVAAVAVGGCRGDDEGQEVAGIPVDDVKERVESVRGLEFEEDQEIQVVSESRALRVLKEVGQEAVREEPERVEAVERSAASFEALLALAGLIETRKDVESLAGSDDVRLGGLYLGGRRELYVVEEEIERGRGQAELILAHELTHALEDQHFGGFEPELEPLSDAGLARQALHEGSAQLLELRYAARHLRDGVSAEDLEERARERIESLEVPAGLRALLTFPYIDGAAFTRELTAEDEGWKLVDEAFGRPPETTAQIFHPQKWIDGETGEEPSLDLDDAVPDGFRRLGGGVLGELHTRTILATAVPLREARRAAAGWGGGSFEVYYRGKLPRLPCRAACRRSTVAVLAWVWDTPRDAQEFHRSAEKFIARLLSRQADGAVALGGTGRSSVIVFAPDAALANRLANQEVPR